MNEEKIDHPAHYMPPVATSFADLRARTQYPDWDHNGADPVPEEHMRRAEVVAATASAEPFVFACSDGSVSLKWVPRPGVSLQLDFTTEDGVPVVFWSRKRAGAPGYDTGRCDDAAAALMAAEPQNAKGPSRGQFAEGAYVLPAAEGSARGGNDQGVDG